MRWNNDDTECLKAMREDGWEVKDIAEEMGYSKSTIEYWIRKLNLLVHKKWTDDEDSLMIYLVTQGYNNTECCEILGRSMDNVKHRKMLLNLTKKYLTYTRIEKREVSADSSYRYSQKPDKLTKVYLIEFEGFYKVGTTQQSITQRFGNRYPKYEVIFYIEVSLTEALKIEKEWLNNVKHLKFVPTTFPEEGRGFTECFKFEA